MMLMMTMTLMIYYQLLLCALCFVSTGLPAEGYFVVCFWCAKTMMWGVFIMGSARSFTKKYFESSSGLVQSNQM